jgi:hypothetical protein
MTKTDRGHPLIFPAYETLGLRVTMDFHSLLPFDEILRKYHLRTGKRELPSSVNLLPQEDKILWRVRYKAGRKFSRQNEEIKT